MRRGLRSNGLRKREEREREVILGGKERTYLTDTLIGSEFTSLRSCLTYLKKGEKGKEGLVSSGRII